MLSTTLQQGKQWLKQSEHPLARRTLRLAKGLRSLALPAPRLLTVPLYHGWVLTTGVLRNLLRILWWTPLFKGRLDAGGAGLYLYGGLPYVCGPLHITLGEGCRVSGVTTFTGRSAGGPHGERPALVVGSNVDIGWQTTIAVGGRVVLGDNVRIAGRALLAGYPGHPLEADARAAGRADYAHQVGDIVLERDVWLATGVSVMAGVCIGAGTVVAAGSVVTRDLPPGVLAGGVPARVIRPIGVGEGANGH